MSAINLEVTYPLSSNSTLATTSPLLSCNWASAAQLVGQIQADNLDVTEVVAQCENVCQVAFNSTSAAGVSVSRAVLLV